ILAINRPSSSTSSLDSNFNGRRNDSAVQWTTKTIAARARRRNAGEAVVVADAAGWSVSPGVSCASGTGGGLYRVLLEPGTGERGDVAAGAPLWHGCRDRIRGSTAGPVGARSASDIWRQWADAGPGGGRCGNCRLTNRGVGRSPRTGVRYDPPVS